MVWHNINGWTANFLQKQLLQFGSVMCSVVQTNELWYPKLHPQFHEAITDVFRCKRPQRKRSWPSSFAVTTDKTILVFRLTVRKQGPQYVAKPMVKVLLISFYRSNAHPIVNSMRNCLIKLHLMFCLYIYYFLCSMQTSGADGLCPLLQRAAYAKDCYHKGPLSQ
jgi:hypothetical protein